ncbi:MAG: hypothetical protein JKY44_02045 [Flavobacteriaceae bacterium]|nr:hypothetical protein [Flavobacteriaceae bacterium]
MRKIVFTLCLCTFSTLVFSQDNNQAKDTLKTTVINVVTSYTPTISDAFKIKKNPKIQLGAKIKKKQLKYQIFSAPVASTFIPKSGVAKGINMGVKERLYQNYLAAGFGNNTTPFIELFLHHATRFENEFGVYAKYISSENSIDETPLNSNFSNMNFGAFYKQEERYYTWKIGADFEKNTYNWYGLPSATNFIPTTITAINEEQSYTSLAIEGELIFEDFYMNSSKMNVSLFSDGLSSKELRFTMNPQFQIPLKGIGRKFNDLILDTSIDYVNGEFAQSYSSTSKLEHSFFTVGLLPKYNFEYNDFTFNLGAKIYFTSDLENKISQLYAYPDVNIQYPLVANYVNFYIGANGDLKTNTYKDFASENPYISPTQFITQTNMKYNFFGGFNGKFTPDVSYDIKASYSDEDDKALFIRNNSKSDGINATGLLGYEYGNSFSYIYDDVTTLSISGELTVDVNRNLVVGANGAFNSYTMTNQTEAWNLPQLTGEIFAKYKRNKWYASTNIFFVSDRKDIEYSGVYPSAVSKTVPLESFVDVNLNGGYHFNDKFTAFIKMNNVLNSDYQRFSNFNVQGFQVLGGISYKFDF